MSKVIVCLNGPPSSGKDTIGEILEQLITKKIGFENRSVQSCALHKFAAPLDGIAKECLHWMTPEMYDIQREQRKDEPLSDTISHSLRDLLISISENTVKPILGEDYFTHSAASKAIHSPCELVIFTDSGFQYEYDHFKSKINEVSPEAKILLVRVYRESTNFDNDSREYIFSDETDIDIHNSSDLLALGFEVTKLFKHISKMCNET